MKKLLNKVSLGVEHTTCTCICTCPLFEGKVGEILRALPQESTVVVKGVNIRTKHTKPQQEGESGQIVTYEAPIHSSKVMLYSEKKKIASRVGYTFTEDGRKVRILKKTGEIID